MAGKFYSSCRLLACHETKCDAGSFPSHSHNIEAFQDGVVRFQIRLSECEPQKSTQAQDGSEQQVLKSSANVGSVSL
jgi:hypothetical protein